MLVGRDTLNGRLQMARIFLRGVKVEHETFSLGADFAYRVFSGANAEVLFGTAENVIGVVLIEQGGKGFRRKFTTTICLDLFGVSARDTSKGQQGALFKPWHLLRAKRR